MTDLPEGWQAAWDSRYQRWYYTHADSGTSQWDPPRSTDAAAASTVQPHSSLYHYHDPHGRLMGPFSVHQLTAWRPCLPMDLVLWPHPTASDAASPAADAADAAANNSITQQQQQPQSIYLAELLGDAELLRHFWESQQQHQQQQAQQQEEPGAGCAKAVAPPAPVWQAWAARHHSACAASSSAYTTASAFAAETASAAGVVEANDSAAVTAPPGYLYHQQQQVAADGLLPYAASFTAASSGSINSTSSNGTSSISSTTKAGGSSFEKYATAVLQGLPADDEAVQLARMAAVHGYSLEQVLQPQQQVYTTAAAAVPDAAASASQAAAGITITSEGVSALMQKDPRSGRLTVIGPQERDAGARGLYGDFASWCDPASLEQSLHTRKQQKAAAARAASGYGGGAAKRTRLSNS